MSSDDVRLFLNPLILIKMDTSFQPENIFNDINVNFDKNDLDLAAKAAKSDIIKELECNLDDSVFQKEKAVKGDESLNTYLSRFFSSKYNRKTNTSMFHSSYITEYTEWYRAFVKYIENSNRHIIFSKVNGVEVVESNNINEGYDRIVMLVTKSLTGVSYDYIIKILSMMSPSVKNACEEYLSEENSNKYNEWRINITNSLLSEVKETFQGYYQVFEFGPYKLGYLKRENTKKM